MKEYAKESLDMKKNFRGGGTYSPKGPGRSINIFATPSVSTKQSDGCNGAKLVVMTDQ